MRTLILLRGAPGSGKSTFIERQGLQPYALSPDTIRLLMGGVVITEKGELSINQSADKYVWQQVEEVLEKKMARGEFIIFDATFQNARDFKMPMRYARLYRYQVYCIDFSDIPEEVALSRNLLRQPYKQVPEFVITRAYERFAKTRLPRNITLISYKEYENKKLLDDFDVPLIDLGRYKKIHHIGDLQGCYAPVAEYFKNGWDDEEFYIFVGDFLDRGIENGEVIRFMVDEVMNRDNVALIFGNHETHIHRYATRQRPVSKEFELNTLPQLMEASFTHQEAETLCEKLQDCFLYRYGNRKVMVSHAGISVVPENPVLIASIQYWKGTGNYEYPVDHTFSELMKDSGWLQVHGHRNSKHLPVQASEKSFNLEAEVEFGGHLRVMTLSADGDIEAIEIKNDIFRKKTKSVRTAPVIDEVEGKLSQQALDQFIAHDFVNVKTFDSYPHIRSYNFTRKAFARGAWDAVNITARGLFVDNDRNIVARSYNKFFNLEERAETEFRNLQKSLKFPITLYVKENGFLGILGFDIVSDDLFFASKSTPEHDFAAWFKEIYKAQVDDVKSQQICDLLKRDNLGMVFEVNDPVRDPHMIEYDEPHVVLLDVLKRKQVFEALPYEQLQQTAERFDLPFKQRALTLNDWKAFTDWYKSVEAAGMYYMFDGKFIEGFVVEDAAGFMFKIKCPYYSFWKYMRSVKERVLSVREKGGDLKRNVSEPLANEFYHWAKEQPSEVLKQDIITVRKLFESSRS